MAVAVDVGFHELRWPSHHCSTPSHSLLSLLSGVVASLGLPVMTVTVPSRVDLAARDLDAGPLHLAR